MLASCLLALIGYSIPELYPELYAMQNAGEHRPREKNHGSGYPLTLHT